MQQYISDEIVSSLIENLKIVTFDDVGVIAVNGYRHPYNSLSAEVFKIPSISRRDKSLVLSLGKELGQILKLKLGHFKLSHRETLQREVYRECDSIDWPRRNQIVPVEDSKRNLIFFYSITKDRVVPFDLKRFKKLMGLDDIKVAKVTIQCSLVHLKDRPLGFNRHERYINCLDASPWVF